MDKYTPFYCDQYNVNDSSYKVISVLKKKGDFVEKGELLIELDSSKSLMEVNADRSGFFYSKLECDDLVTVGELIFIISSESIGDAELDSLFNQQKTDKQTAGLDFEDANAREYTIKAKILLSSLGQVDLSMLPQGLITEKIVKDTFGLEKNTVDFLNGQANIHGIKKLAFIGAGQGLIQVLDIVFKVNSFIPACIFDDTQEKIGKEYLGVPVIGEINIDKIVSFYEDGKFDLVINCVSTSIDFRKRIFSSLTERGVPFANLVHPSASIGMLVTMGTGNVILSNVSIGPCALIGDDNFISAHCNIEHHNSLGSHCTFGPGVMTSGSVIIENEVKFGTGVFIEPKVRIGSQSIIGSGLMINRHIGACKLVLQEKGALVIKDKK